MWDQQRLTCEYGYLAELDFRNENFEEIDDVIFGMTFCFDCVLDNVLNHRAEKWLSMQLNSCSM